MATYGRLRNPPIQEALVDIRFASTAKTIDAEALAPIRKTLIERYPLAAPRRRIEAHLTAQPGHAPDVVAKEDYWGLFLRNNDRSKLAQFRVDGFTFNLLAGYTTAEALIDEALELWELLVRVSEPNAVVRVALRYINRLLLPVREGDDFAIFLTASPVIPDEAPQGIGNFLTRVLLPPKDAINVTSVVTQRLEGPAVAGVPYTLDIDAFRDGDFGVTSDALRPVLADLRLMTDRLFFAFLTERALEPYR